MISRTMRGICLGYFNNRQGGYTFLCLFSTHTVTRNVFADIPITKEVIPIVSNIFMPKCQPNYLTFRYRNSRTNLQMFRRNAEISVFGGETDGEITHDLLLFRLFYLLSPLLYKCSVSCQVLLYYILIYYLIFPP